MLKMKKGNLLDLVKISNQNNMVNVKKTSFVNKVL